MHVGRAQTPPQPCTLTNDAIPFSQVDDQIRQAFRTWNVEHYAEAAELYLSMIGCLDGALTNQEQTLLTPHLHALAAVLPASHLLALNVNEALARNDLSLLSDGAGAWLVQWWRSQDPLPATDNNERVEEHLARVVYATEKYAYERDPRGYDDRGEIYIRFGSPTKSKKIDLKNGISAPEAVMSLHQIFDNEFWVYSHLGDAAHYLFVRETKNRPFRLGDSYDLFPPNRASLAMMEAVYAQLALQHPAYGTLYDALNIPSTPDNWPEHVASLQRLSQVRSEDSNHEWQRAESIPVSYTHTLGHTESLDTSVRWARFLNPDGTTRTELYWSLEGHELKPSKKHVRRLRKMGARPSSKYLVRSSLAHLATDYTSNEIHQKHYLIDARAKDALPVRSFIVSGDTALYHLALQWDQYWTETINQQLQPGAHLKIGTVHLDSLEALHGNGLQLEMSDLKPLRLGPSGGLETAVPFPQQTLSSQTPLALYLELYHLTFGENDQTRYTLEYEIEQADKSGRLFKKKNQFEGAAVRTSFTGDSRTAKEYMVLDLSAWKGDIRVIVRATDETTGHQLARTLTFHLAD